MTIEQTNKAVPMPPQAQNAMDKGEKGVNPFAAKDEKDDEKDGKKKPPFLAEKSQLTEADLTKSLDNLEAIVKSAPDARKAELFAKGMAMSADEHAELMQLMSGASAQPNRGEQIAKSFENGQSEDTKNVLNVSAYLRDMHDGVVKSMSVVSDDLAKSRQQTQEQILVLAKGVLDIGRVEAENNALLKSIVERLGGVMRQPARAPKSAQPQGQAIEKSFAGGSAAGESLSKSMIADLLTQINMDSPSGLSKSGERLDLAVAKWEQFETISPALLDEVKALYQRTNGTNGRAR